MTDNYIYPLVGKQRSPRLSGIDILQGAALLGVAFLHAGNGKPSVGWAGFMTHFSSFAVPFFLATSFYLGAGKFYTSKTSSSLKSRLSRLLIPYGIWVLIYLLFNILKYAVSGRVDELGTIFRDPVNIIFFGSPAYHLYFIPLLLTGTVFSKGVEAMAKRWGNLQTLLLSFVASTIAYEVILVTGNGFELGSNVAFQTLSSGLELNIKQYSVLRIILVAIAWGFRCLPYVVLALLLQHPSIRKHLPSWNIYIAAITCLLFLIINAFGNQMLPIAVYEIARGYTALIFAIALSATLTENALIKSLGLCSFGIYLMHLIWMETSKTILGKIFPSLLTEVSILTPY
jgi:Acyltransferase family